MLELINRVNARGKWLCIASGDGRYLKPIIARCEKLIAIDLDKNALAKLYENCPKNLRDKLELRHTDVFSTSLDMNFFSGIICTGFLHLFSKEKLQSLFFKLFESLQPKGNLLFDFAFNIKRTSNTTRQIDIKGSIKHSLVSSMKLLDSILGSHRKTVLEGQVGDFIVQLKHGQYTFSCDVLSVGVQSLNHHQS